MMQARHQISNAVIPVEKESVSFLPMTSKMNYSLFKETSILVWSLLDHAVENANLMINSQVNNNKMI